MTDSDLSADKPIYTARRDGYFTLETHLFFPRPLEIVFPFFADAGNLEIITPPWLRFEILMPVPISLHAGAVIEYRLHLHGFPMRWQSEITAWQPPFRFVDEQRRGPYRRWIHEHSFAQCEGGSEMHDFVRYSVPGGWLVNFLYVKREVRRIFEYRSRKLAALFA